ncbi:MAG: type II toxin-antitoxin system RelE/ParE family toxin [Acidobacteria bacterium]|nr:type II toxin-antitoxin system RelE/ParE family toxin [Acidobacteriota bacterium]
MQSLPPKQYKPVAARIFLLARDRRPADGRLLEGHPALRRVDQGEYRVLYSINDEARVVVIRRMGKRSDAEVYRGL